MILKNEDRIGLGVIDGKIAIIKTYETVEAFDLDKDSYVSEVKSFAKSGGTAVAVVANKVFFYNDTSEEFFETESGPFVKYDVNNQGLNETERQNARTNIQAVSKDELQLTYPTTIGGTGKLNNVALPDGNGMIKFGAAVTEVSGIVSNNSDAKQILIWSDNTDGLTLTEQDTDSDVANRFLRSINVPYQTWVPVVYDPDLDRWVNGNTGELQETDDRYFEVVNDVLTLKFILPDTDALQAFVRGDAVLAYVRTGENSGFYNYVSEGDFDSTADFSQVFPAQDGGYWVKDKEGIFSDVINQLIRPIDNTGWVKQYTISLPERGDVGDEDYSTDPYYDFALFKGNLYWHESNSINTTTSGSRGERFLQKFPFQARFVGWRGNYRIDECFLYIDGELRISDVARDVIRVVKKSRLNYELHVRQDFDNLVFGVETTYRRFSGADIVIDGKTSVSATVTAPEEIVYNFENYLPYNDKGLQNQLKISNPVANPIYPVKIDGNGDYTLTQWQTEGSEPSRTGVEKETEYTTSPYGWGTATGGLPDSITIQSLGNRQFLRFKLERNQATKPERSELSTLVPQTAYGGANDVRWFGGYIRANYYDDNPRIFQDPTIIFQFLPSYFPAERPPCQILSIRGGRYFWRIQSNYRGSENISQITKPTYFDLGPVSWGTFEKWVMQCKFNYDNGFLKVWKNDVLLIDFEGPTTWDDVGEDVPYVKFGVYKPFWLNRPPGYVTTTDEVIIDHMDTRLGDVDCDYDSISPLPIQDYEKLNIDINSNDSDFETANIETANVTTAEIETANIEAANVDVFNTTDGLLFENFGETTTTNVDSIIKSGWFEVSSSNAGIPVANSGILRVARRGGFIHQFFITLSNIVYSRFRSSGVWTDWKKGLDEDDLVTANITTANITTANITTANVTVLQLGGTTTTSADSIITSGWYDLSSGNAGIPIAIAGVLSVARAGSNVSQVYITTGNRVYTRYRTGGVWSDWVRVQHVYTGTTAQRPTTGRYTGMEYFDATLGKPIWWDGSGWVDSTGTTA